MRLILFLFALIVLPLSPAIAQEDEFNWEKSAEEDAASVEETAASDEQPQTEPALEADPAAEAATLEPAAATPEESEVPETFQWTEETGRQEQEPTEPVEEGASVAEEAPAAAESEEGYNAMLKENLELRRKIADATKAGDSVRDENARLAVKLTEMERKTAQFAALIEDMEKQRTSTTENPEKVIELEQKLESAQREKNQLGEEISKLRAEMEAEKATPSQEPEAIEPRAATVGVKLGSDLFKEKERENSNLKDKLLEIDAAREQAVKERKDLVARTARAEEAAAKASEQQKDLEKKLDDATAAQKESKRTIEKLMDRIPELEEELSKMKSKEEKTDSGISSKERDLQAMQVEVRKREQRIAKAERMAAILDKAREEVIQVSEKEKRDMHYNMAIVYAKEGKFRDAESEYLKALRTDPNDAAVHYNLGILYDDDLNDKDRAAMHYRKYLKLNPHAGDVDQVKGWLMKIELGQ